MSDERNDGREAARDEERGPGEARDEERASGEARGHEDPGARGDEDDRRPPREEERGPKPPPGMDSVEKKRGKGRGQAPLPRDRIGGRG